MLRGSKVVLRLFTEEDLEELFALDSDIAARGEYFPIALHTVSEMQKQFRETGWWQEDQGRMVIASGDSKTPSCSFGRRRCSPVMRSATRSSGLRIGAEDT